MTKELLITLALIAAICLLTLINTTLEITILKKKPKTPLQQLWEQLPKAIANAEKMGFKTGKDKKDYVMKLSITFLSDLLKTDFLETKSKYQEIVSQKIEDLLSVPQATKYKEL